MSGKKKRKQNLLYHTSQPKKEVKRRLTDKDKLDIIGFKMKFPRMSNVELGRRYNIDESSVRYILKNKEEIRERYLAGNEDNRDLKKGPGKKNHLEFDKKIFNWITAMRQQNIPVPPTMIKVHS